MTAEHVAVRHPGTLLASISVVVVASGAVLAHAAGTARTGPRAVLAALDVPQVDADRLAPEDAARLVVDPASTRLLVTTPDGAHYVARNPSGELCLIRLPDAGVPLEVCVPDRVGADTTLGDEGTGQVRLVADSAALPSTAEGWQPAGPNVWVRD